MAVNYKTSVNKQTWKFHCDVFFLSYAVRNIGTAVTAKESIRVMNENMSSSTFKRSICIIIWYPFSYMLRLLKCNRIFNAFCYSDIAFKWNNCKTPIENPNRLHEGINDWIERTSSMLVKQDQSETYGRKFKDFQVTYDRH